MITYFDIKELYCQIQFSQVNYDFSEMGYSGNNCKTKFAKIKIGTIILFLKT